MREEAGKGGVGGEGLIEPGLPAKCPHALQLREGAEISKKKPCTWAADIRPQKTSAREAASGGGGGGWGGGAGWCGYTGLVEAFVQVQGFNPALLPESAAIMGKERGEGKRGNGLLQLDWLRSRMWRVGGRGLVQWV